ncbi:MAG: Flp/Fap pilin component [Pelotomaculum sp. PtaB.Bin104]|nr:MAG: Flp/Fap pilin component [Pelotomaculum sp. PtaB.Bin104]
MFKKVRNLIIQKTSGLRELVTILHRNEKGQGMAEYGLIIALVAVVVIAALTLMGTKLMNKFTAVNNALN